MQFQTVLLSVSLSPIKHTHERRKKKQILLFLLSLLSFLFHLVILFLLFCFYIVVICLEHITTHSNIYLSKHYICFIVNKIRVVVILLLLTQYRAYNGNFGRTGFVFEQRIDNKFNVYSPIRARAQSHTQLGTQQGGMYLCFCFPLLIYIIKPKMNTFTCTTRKRNISLVKEKKLKKTTFHLVSTMVCGQII